MALTIDQLGAKLDRVIQQNDALLAYQQGAAGRGKGADDRVLGFLQQRNFEPTGTPARAVDTEDLRHLIDFHQWTCQSISRLADKLNVTLDPGDDLLT